MFGGLRRTNIRVLTLVRETAGMKAIFAAYGANRNVMVSPEPVIMWATIRFTERTYDGRELIDDEGDVDEVVALVRDENGSAELIPADAALWTLIGLTTDTFTESEWMEAAADQLRENEEMARSRRAAAAT